MRLRSIIIQRYRAIDDLFLRFEDPLGRIRPITVIAGPNGCGKTTVLYAIVQTLRGLTGYRTVEVAEPSELDIRRSGGVSGLSPKPNPIFVQLDIEFDETERQAIPQIFEDTRELHKQWLPQPIAGGAVKLEWKYPPGRDPQGNPYPWWHLSKIEPNQALNWFKGRRYAIRGWRDRKLRKNLLLDVGGVYLFPQDRNLQTRVVGNRSAEAAAAGKDLFEGDNPDSDEEKQSPKKTGDSSVWGVLEWLGSYSQSPRKDPLPEEDNWEKRVKDQFKRICSPKEYLGFMYQRDDPFGAPYFQDGESVYPLNMAASGEQVIIEYITRLTYPTPMNHSLILIDEPEVHLHPGWIRQLYRALPQIGINNQYILTTHSLELRTMAAEDGCLIDLGNIAT